MSRPIFVTAFAFAVACAAEPSADERFVATPPDRVSFPVVSDLLEHRCGSLDCHGTTARNLRLYGNEGLRFDPTSRPSRLHNTTSAEYDENFLSLVGIEPEVMSAVTEQAGAEPDRLTFYRKALGTENHKGGQLFQPGDDQDVCVKSWLAGKTDAVSCANATATTP